ncbi:Dual 3',5'-cyclic-AMP and -GMP phosphodiesterase 11A [Pteropus alecto]|uniref:Dual 3',5'-cyclic-AMP and-GMP phosphodiesterase 11A n=1 Tax=Pteropus alecto TaxID=9402 RepID=L5K2K5_PTEAL|nr:Dual 3',5'-cyclic-AMP and -GMP phosphodiesterase 11A [Pteropus alecto]
MPGCPRLCPLAEQVSKVLSVMGQEEAEGSFGAPMIPIQLPQGIALVKVNVKLKPMVDSVAANRSKWEELHQKRLLVSAASPSSASFMVAGADSN